MLSSLSVRRYLTVVALVFSLNVFISVRFWDQSKISCHILDRVVQYVNKSFHWLESSRVYTSSFFCRQPNCNNFTFEYIIRNPDACSADTRIYLLFLVTTTHGKVEARQAIRNTWASTRRYRNRSIRTMFVLGQGRTAAEEDRLLEESRRYGDIIQGRFVDSYRTLTEKVVFSLGWVRRYCAQASHVIKTDDDVFHVPQRYVDYLVDGRIPDRFVGGWCVTARPFRDEDNKKFVSYDVYPHEYTPFYCNGGGYVITQNALRDIVAVAPHVRYTNMEDHFVTGLCRYTVAIPVGQISGVLAKGTRPQPCTLRTWIKSTQDNVSPEEMNEYWQLLNATSVKCVSYFDAKKLIFLVSGLFLWTRILFVMFSQSEDRGSRIPDNPP